MGKKFVKYNPAFLSDSDLIDSFVVRHADLEIIMQVIRENVTQSNQHMMVIGPREIGKTTLALRAIAEVRKDEELRDKWYPLVFAEESYAVTSAGEFWLEALFHLGQQEKGSKWNETYKELQDEKNEDRLAERALGQLLDFADSQNRRLLLVVENFNMLFGDQVSDEDAWKIRKTLQHEKRIMLLATATTRFEQMDGPDKAMFEMFRPLNMLPLNEAECREIWNSVTGKDLSEERIRPLQILTGGNPRLMTIISSFGKDISFKKLMNELTRLVDDHTEYFKSHLDGLAPIERKVYLALAELWDPSLAKDVAQTARVNVNKTSSLLGRLKDRGAVVVVEEKGSKKKYQVAERMYNIYYLMRRRGAASGRVKAVVNFMAHFYGREELVKFTKSLLQEACGLGVELRSDHFLFFEAILNNSVCRKYREELIQAIPEGFSEWPDTPESLKGLGKGETKADKEVDELVKQAEVLIKSGEPEKLKEAELLYRKAIKIAPKNPKMWAGFGLALQFQDNRCDEAEQAYRKVIELIPKEPYGWSFLGNLFHLDPARYDEAEKMYLKVIELEPEDSFSWLQLGQLLGEHLERYEEAAEAYRRANELETKAALGWTKLGEVLFEHLGKYEEAAEAFRKATELEPESGYRWLQYSVVLTFQKNYKEAERACKKSIELEPENGFGWLALSWVLLDADKKSEALEAAVKYLRDSQSVEKSVDGAITLFVRLAASGLGREGLEILQASPSAEILEPLVVGLQLFVGEDVNVAAEIMEVGRDVVKRIEESCEEMNKT